MWRFVCRDSARLFFSSLSHDSLFRPQSRQWGFKEIIDISRSVVRLQARGLLHLLWSACSCGSRSTCPDYVHDIRFLVFWDCGFAQSSHGFSVKASCDIVCHKPKKLKLWLSDTTQRCTPTHHYPAVAFRFTSWQLQSSWHCNPVLWYLCCRSQG